jgi:RNA polymerase sigma-70 factor (ECF subfamily)
VNEAVFLPDVNTLEDAVRQHSRLVYRISFSVLRNHHDAEDATQEVFMRVLRYRRDLKKVGEVRTWLARIAWRVAVERRKKSGVSNHESFDESAVECSSIEPGVDEVLLNNERYAAVTALIAALPPKLRDPLTLSTLEEMTPHDVAVVLGINEAAVRSRIFRARQILKEKLAAMMGVDHAI